MANRTLLLAFGLAHLGAPLSAQTAIFKGLVVDGELDVPLPGARILLDSVEVARTDDSGRFVLPDVKPGPYTLDVLQLAYYPLASFIVLRADKVTEAKIHLEPNVFVLEGVTVEGVGRDHRRYAEIVDRLRSGRGHFFTREQIEQSGAPEVSFLIAELPGVRLGFVGLSSQLLMGYGRGACRPTILVDGVRYPLFDSESLDDLVAKEDVELIEVYDEFQKPFDLTDTPFSGCGLVGVWTRLGG